MIFPWFTKKPEKKKCWHPSPAQVIVATSIVGAFGVGVWFGYKALKPMMQKLGCCCGDEANIPPEG